MGGLSRKFAAIGAGALCAVASTSAWAQTQPTDTQEPTAVAEEASNVTPYSSSFFAEYRPNTARDMIDRLPGFTFDGGSSARGFAGNAGNVLVDGERPPSRGDSLSDIIARIPASGVARIDIIRGGAPGIDMQGEPVIANIIRKPDAGLSGSVYVSAGIDARGDFDRTLTLQGQRQAGGKVIEGSLRYFRDEGAGEEFRVRRSPTDVLIESGHRESSGRFEQIEGAGSLETLFFGGELRLNAQGAMQNNGNKSVEDLIFPGGVNRSRSGGQRDSGELGLRYTRGLPAGFDSELVAFSSMYKSESRNASIRPAFTNGSITDGEGGETIGSFAAHSPKYGDWKFDAGTELAFNYQESQSRRTLNGQPFAVPGDKSRVEELRSDSHLVGTWAPSSALSVETAMRYERSTIEAGDVEKTLGFIKPRLNVSWSPGARQQVGFRLERIVDQLSFPAFLSSVSFNSSLDETIVGIGNNDLEPSHYWVIEGRYEKRWSDEGVFTAQVEHRLIDDFVDRTVVLVTPPPPPGGGPAPAPYYAEITANVGEAVRTTYSVSTTVPLDDFGMQGGLFEIGFDVRTSEMADPVTDVMRRITGNEPFGWNVSLSQNIERLNFNWSVFANGGDEAVSYSPRSIRPYENDFSLGANFSWRPARGLTLSGGVNNILAGDDHQRTFFYTAPRHVGALQYVEESFEPGVQSMYLSLRKTFS